MITVAVIEKTAEGRNIIVDEVTQFLRPGHTFVHLVPQISVIPLSLQELRFRETPHICILGRQLCEESPQEIRAIKKLFPRCFVIARISEVNESLSRIDELMRLGADDTFTGIFTATNFFKYIIQINRAQQQQKQGIVILVDSGKGGIGVTSLAAGLADVISLSEKKVALLDLDTETQDLSRFLRIRPLLNEHLDLLLSQQRPLLAEYVQQCLVPFSGNAQISCVTPPSLHHNFTSIKSTESQIFFSILKMLDELHDVVIIDAGAARGSFLEALYRVSDKVVFAVNNDPASLHASVEKIQSVSARLGQIDLFTLVNNAPERDGLSDSHLKQEYLKLTGFSENQWIPVSIPRCSSAKRWPGSGETILSLGRMGVAYSLETLSRHLGFVLEEKTPASYKLFTPSLISSTLYRLAQATPTSRLLKEERSLRVDTTVEPTRQALPSPRLLPTSSSVQSEHLSAPALPYAEAESLVSAVELAN
jgi:cellulose biosynthesis protein BcsQ